MKQARGEFQSERFAGAGFTEEDQRFAREDFEGEATENVAFVE